MLSETIIVILIIKKTNICPFLKKIGRQKTYGVKKTGTTKSLPIFLIYSALSAPGKVI